MFRAQDELAQTRQTIRDLEDQNRALADTVDDLHAQKAEAAAALAGLHGRFDLSQQLWAKERDELVAAERRRAEEYDVARQAMQDWEVIATEERAVRESLSDRVVELEDSLAAQRNLYERMAADHHRQGSSMQGLQHALQEIQDGVPSAPPLALLLSPLLPPLLPPPN